MLATRSGRKASQNEHELRGFISLMRDRGVRRYLEIGARHGDTFFEVMGSLPVGSFGLAVDLPGGLWGTAKSVTALKSAVSDLRVAGYEAHYILGDSHKASTLAAIEEHGPFDAILIDGDHTLAGVSRDWAIYGGLASLVAFHDIVGTGEIEKVGGRPVEVPMFWQRIKTNFEHREFVDRDSKMGIGVLLCG